MAFETLTSREVLDILKISRSTLHLWLKAGKLKGYKVGRRWLFKRDEIEALVEASVRRPKASKGTVGDLLRYAGLWGDMPETEAKALIKEIYSSRSATQRDVRL